MKRALVCLIALGAALPALALAQTDNDGDKKDRQVYNRLISEIRAAHVKLASAYKRGVEEARENNGQATTKTRAEIVGLRDEIDRKSVRLMLVADRHGWDVPQFRLEDFEKQAEKDQAAKPDNLVDEFFPPDPRITGALSDQARLLAGKVRLPIIPATRDLPRDED